MSTKRYVHPPNSTTVSTASRVVPGASCTIERSSPMRRLNSVDFPTFGRPRIATRTSPTSSSDASASVGSGKRPTTASRRSPVRLPCSAETATGSPRPRA